MPDRPIQASLPKTAPQPLAQAKAPAKAGPSAPEVTGDRLALANRPPAIEADVRLAMRGQARLEAEGSVRVRRGFLERFIRDVLDDKRVFPHMKVGFDATSRRFTGEGAVRWLGIPWPVAIAARPRIVGDKLGVEFEAVQLVLGSWRLDVPFLKGLAARIVLDELRTTWIRASKGERAGVVLMEPASIIHELGIAPPYVQLDMQRTKLSLQIAESGDVTLGLKAGQTPAAPANTPRSDIALTVDEAALTAFMRQALGRDYDLRAITLRENGAAVRGQADYKPVSDTLTAAKGILLLAALAGGGRNLSNVDTSAVVVKGDLDLDVEVEGRTMVVKPSIGLAAGEMMKVLTTAGIPAERQGGAVWVNLDAAAQALGATLSTLRIDARGVSLQAGVDIETLIRNPRLLADD